MTSDSDSASDVRALLTSVSQATNPTEIERSRIYSRMTDAKTSSVQFRNVDPRTDIDADRTSVLGEFDLVVVDTTGPTEQARGHSRQSREVPRVLAYAAAVMAIVAGFLVFSSFGDEIEEVAVVGIGPEGRFSADIGGIAVSFSVEEPVLLDASGQDFISIRSIEFGSMFETSREGVSGLVILARPSSIFGDLVADAWFAENNLQVTPAVARHRGARIEAWNVVVTTDVASALGCEPREPCVEFASLSEDRGLSLEAGFGFNRIRLIPTDDGEPLILFSNSAGPEQGPSDDPVTRISDQILATLTL